MTETTHPTDPPPGPTGRGVAVVTGALTGIGRAFAEVLADIGFDLVIAADDPAIHALAGELEEGGATVVGLHVDLSGAPGVEHLCDVAGAQGAPVTVGVLNGGAGAHETGDETDLERRLRSIDLDVRSTVHLAGLLAPDMVARGHGRLLFVPSAAGGDGGSDHAARAAARAFVHTFAEGLRRELLGTGVGVTSLRRSGDTGPAPDRSAPGESNAGTDRETARDGVAAMLAGDGDAAPTQDHHQHGARTSVADDDTRSTR